MFGVQEKYSEVFQKFTSENQTGVIISERFHEYIRARTKTAFDGANPDDPGHRPDDPRDHARRLPPLDWDLATFLPGRTDRGRSPDLEEGRAGPFASRGLIVHAGPEAPHPI
jgi:hypothetical protein